MSKILTGTGYFWSFNTSCEGPEPVLPPPPSAERGEVVKVVVGKGERSEELEFHQGLLCAASSYFEAGFKKGRFKEGNEGVIRLEEDDVDTVKRFKEWLYGRPTLPKTLTSDQGPDGRGVADIDMSIFRLYYFADCRGVLSLKNVIINLVAGLLRYTQPTVSLPNILDIYENTPPGDGMRRLMALMLAAKRCKLGRVLNSKSSGCPTADDVPNDLLLDYILALEQCVGVWTTKKWQGVRICDFHDHPGRKPTFDAAAFGLGLPDNGKRAWFIHSTTEETYSTST
ncbi:btb poz domain protein [Diplodia corticola]|uniref:Btb poz domain protein n=1 Tax=Diplodia corticola TaxID=236234 RepID=A0A1J9R5B5_9PEZI|nr:btb poz domain protein [Diplodia corticola]OJD35418.1 btb poz domain protein [Diplodia corticola]